MSRKGIKISIISSAYACFLAGLSMLAACSDEDMAQAIAPQAPQKDNIELSDVEIVLGAVDDNEAGNGDMSSRASIDSYTFGGFNTNKNDTLGIFALATGIIWQNMENGEGVGSDNQRYQIRWNGDWEYKRDKDGYITDSIHVFNELFSVYLNNTRAGILYAMDPVYYSYRSQVVWMDSRNAKKYYPLRSLHTYSFYAYNPRVDSIQYQPNRIIAVMQDLKGCEDVIWGCIEPAPTDPYRGLAYSADYFRIRYNMDHMPDVMENMRFRFSHKLMRLTFEIVAGAIDETLEATQRDYDNAYKTKVHSISIVNVPDEMYLVVADKSPEERNRQGELTYSRRRMKYCYLKERGRNVWGETVLDTILTPVSPKPKDPMYVEGNRDETNVPAVTKIGESIMLPVLTEADNNAEPYVMQILLESPDGTFYRKEFTLETPRGKYEAGKSYNIRLKIYNPADLVESGGASGWEVINPAYYLDYIDPAKREEIERLEKEEEEKRKEEEEKRKEEEERNKYN